MTDPRLLLAAALLDPAFAGVLANELEQGTYFSDELIHVALAVAALHERGDPGGVGWVASWVGSWGWRHADTARRLAVSTPEVQATIHELRQQLMELLPIESEPVVLAAKEILG